MPRFNDLAQVTPQIGYFWYDQRFVFQDCSTGVCVLRLSDGTVVSPRGCNALGANQSRAWVAWLGGYGVFDSFGRYFADSDVAMNVPGDAAVGPDGSYAIKVSRNSFGPWDVLMPDGSRWRLTDGDAKDIQILSGRRALYRDPQGIVRANFKLRGRPSGPCTAPRAADDGMLLYQRQPDGALMLGRKEIMPPGFYYGIDVLRTGTAYHDSQYHVTWSPTAADTNAQFRHYAVSDIDPLPDPPYIPNPMPPIQEDAMIAYGTPVPGFLPGDVEDNGNGTVSVRKPSGKYVCVTPTGAVEERDSGGGVWESFRKGRGCLIAERDGEAQGPKVYVLPLAE